MAQPWPRDSDRPKGTNRLGRAPAGRSVTVCSLILRGVRTGSTSWPQPSNAWDCGSGSVAYRQVGQTRDYEH
jgi:hypothetical protein